MKVKVETYKLVCDCCGETFENLNGYTCFTEDPDGSLIWEDACDSGWQHIGDKHFCENCWDIDDDDNYVIKDGRKFTEDGEEVKA